jgi:hypothetical protein
MNETFVMIFACRRELASAGSWCARRSLRRLQPRYGGTMHQEAELLPKKAADASN